MDLVDVKREGIVGCGSMYIVRWEDGAVDGTSGSDVCSGAAGDAEAVRMPFAESRMRSYVVSSVHRYASAAVDDLRTFIGTSPCCAAADCTASVHVFVNSSSDKGVRRSVQPCCLAASAILARW